MASKLIGPRTRTHTHAHIHAPHAHTHAHAHAHTHTQGQSGSRGLRCTGITFDVSKLVDVTKYQMESKGDLRAGPGTCTISVKL